MTTTIGNTDRASADTVTVPEAARLLGIDRGTLYRAIRENSTDVPHVRFGKAIRIPRLPLEQFLTTGTWPAP